MRATLIGTGAFLFLAYPLVMLFAIAINVDQAQQKPHTAAIILTPRSAREWLESDPGQGRRDASPRATIRRFGD